MPRRSTSGRTLAGLILCAVALAITPAGGAERVVVSIKPIHSLVAGVMGKTGEPYLIIGGSATPHSYSLKPSVARNIREATLIFWVGDRLETALAKPIGTLGRRATVVTLSQSPGLKTARYREGGLSDDHHHDAHDRHDGKAIDQHFWLDPDNARIFVDGIASALAAKKPDDAMRFRANAQTLKRRLDSLTLGIEKRLQPVRDRPFIVFHDAYQYFERRFGLSTAGSIAVSPGRAPGARRLSAIREKIRTTRALCVFTEPQFTPRLAESIVRGTQARTGILDPLGADLPAGPDLYFSLMRNMADAFATCLGAVPAVR